MTGSKHRFVALLRGINVGGHAIIKMADLRKLFESLGLTDVATHIQTGNVVFSTREADSRRLVRQIEAKLLSSIGRKIAVLVQTRTELQSATSHNPFDPERWAATQRCHLMFLSGEPDAASQQALMALQGEEYRFHLHGKVLYYAYSKGFDGKRRSIDFEKVLGVAGTSRTWQVVNQLIELSS
jgi:uncharacterized protein (DUF1697 family)